MNFNILICRSHFPPQILADQVKNVQTLSERQLTFWNSRDSINSVLLLFLKQF